MSSEFGGYIITVIVAIIAAAPGILALRRQIGRDEVERAEIEAGAAEKLTGAALTLVNGLERRIEVLEGRLKEQADQIDDLNDRIKVLEHENHYLRDGATRLVDQVEAFGEKPVWRLSEEGS